MLGLGTLATRALAQIGNIIGGQSGGGVVVISPPPVTPTVKETILEALEAVAAAVAAVGNLSTATISQLSGVTAAVSVANGLVVAAIDTYEQEIPTTTFAGMVVGMPVPALVLTLQTTTTAVQQEAILQNILAYLNRISVNIADAPG